MCNACQVIHIIIIGTLIITIIILIIITLIIQIVTMEGSMRLGT